MNYEKGIDEYLNFQNKIKKNSTIAIIPARGGSKGIPGKNIKLLDGKPLIYYSINHALKTQAIDEVYVSSDSDEILGIAKSFERNVLKDQ